MDPLSISTAVAGFLSLSIEAYDILSTSIRETRSASAEAQSLQFELAALNHVLEQLIFFLRDEYRDRGAFDETCVLYSVIAACQKQIRDLFVKCDPLRSQKKLSRLISQIKWPFKRDECVEIVENLHRIVRLSDSLTIGNW
jgi:hypothetical protein